MVKKAIEYATKAHEGQVRKGTTKPYIIHPLEVGEIVATMTDDKELICAAILHDTVEDCEGVTVEKLADAFSDRVANLVAQESEDKTKSWTERKSATIERLKSAPRDVKLIALADKLSNIRGISSDYAEIGEEVWLKFRMKDKDIIGWYYKGIRESLKSEFQGCAAYEEYCSLTSQVFGK